MATYTDAIKLATKQQQRSKNVSVALNAELKRQMQDAAGQAEEIAKILLSGGISSRQLMLLGHPFALNKRTNFKSRLNKQGIIVTKTRAIPRSYTSAQKDRQRTFGAVPALPINAQTGRLRDATYVYASQHGSSYQLHFRNPVSYSSFLIDPQGLGTSRMKPRGFWKAFVSGVKIDFKIALLAAKREAERK